MSRTSLLLRFFAFAAVCAVGLAVAAEDADPALGLQAPEGFQVATFATDDWATNVSAMTVDPRGRVVVAGPGYIKILHDDDADGRADRASLFADFPRSSAHGLCFDPTGPHPVLLCTGDNGVWRLEDRDGDDRADPNPTRLVELGHSEHGANGVVQGPDGDYYVLCGNDAGLDKLGGLDPSSPVAKVVCGGLLRLSRDGRRREVTAHGFRNPYDFDFNAAGHLFTVDSDNERDYALPWYAPTRLFDIAQGCEHGWLQQGWQQSWNRPPYFYDAQPRLVEIGRGSPTGVVVYRHRQFPERYRGGVFSACWTFGRIYHFPLSQNGGRYAATKETFLQTTGDVGFAPCDLAVGPAGDLFVAIGGRGTHGGVFRVRYVGGTSNVAGDATPKNPPHAAPSTVDELTDVLAADQPLAAWSRARWVPTARKLGCEAFAAAMFDAARPESHRVRAVEIVAELFDGPTADEVRRAATECPPAVVARCVWACDRRCDRAVVEPLVAALRASQKDAQVVRALDEASRQANTGSFVPRALLSRNSEPPSTPISVQENELLVRVPPGAFGDGRLLDRAATIRRLNTAPDRADRLVLIRYLQTLCGDFAPAEAKPNVYAGYIPRDRRQSRDAAVAAALAEFFPTGDADVDREAARTLAMLGAEVDGLRDKLAAKWTEASDPLDDIHYLIAASLLPGARSASFSRRTAGALATLHEKLDQRKLYPDRNWPDRILETVDALVERDGRLSEALVDSPRFGRAEHALFVLHLDVRQQAAAARRILATIAKADPDELEVTAPLVQAVGVLPPEESLPVLRRWWRDAGVRDLVFPVLARYGDVEDRGRFVEALASYQPNVVERAADLLLRFEATVQPAEVAAAVRALRQACLAPDAKGTRVALARLLERWSGRKFDVVELPTNPTLSYAAVFEWFREAHPAEAARMATAGGVDPAAWRTRLLAVDWDGGDVARGKLVFEKKQCHRCHVGAGKLGPDLAGAAARFSTADLFTAILDPSKDVAPLYRTTQVETRDGRTFNGLPIYDSAEGLLLQTTPDVTVRLLGGDIASRRPGSMSLMPAGLLNDADDGALADLYAYLKSLKK